MACLERFRGLFIQRVDAARFRGLGHNGSKRRLEFVVIDTEFTDKIAIHHTRSLPVTKKRNDAVGREPARAEVAAGPRRVGVYQVLFSFPSSASSPRSQASLGHAHSRISAS